MNSEQATQIMATHMKGDWHDRDRLNNPITQNNINDNGRAAQIEMINAHYPGMNEVDKARADRTLKQIGG